MRKTLSSMSSYNVIRTESFREASPIKHSALSICDKADGDQTVVLVKPKQCFSLDTSHSARIHGDGHSCHGVHGPLGSTLHISFFLAQSSQVIQEGVVITHFTDEDTETWRT